MKPMRKASRQQDAAWALEVFDKVPYVMVSMIRPDIARSIDRTTVIKIILTEPPVGKCKL